ncbi:ATP-dependent dethiobiotin synthetase BioD, partial [Kribbia dieselivorans]|uniref:ATP-dependent dethiobiotin synthetase BioD n=1 Tax=Kribbia dieselivorans TaxID=331526 RepID=UPI0009F9C998
AGVPTHEGCRLVEPMAPRQAAAVEGARLPTLAEHVAAVEGLAARQDHVLIEGAGGLLVELTDAGETVADLAAALLPPADTPPADQRVGVVVVARSALGTLNHTSLTLDWLAARGFPVLGIVLGSVGEHPSRLEALNHKHLNTLGPGVIGQVPHGAPTMTAQAFAAAAPGWFTTTA